MTDDALPNGGIPELPADAELSASLREVWRRVDPMPTDLIDRMVAAVAVADLSREYALLTAVEGATRTAVRSDAGTATLQFSDGEVSVLLHVTVTEEGRRRVDGWVDAETLAIRLITADGEWSADAGAHGRFAFPEIPPGLARLRLAVRGRDGAIREFQTPQFEA